MDFQSILYPLLFFHKTIPGTGTAKGSSTMQDVIKRIQDQEHDHVETLKAWLRIPSISTDSGH